MEMVYNLLSRLTVEPVGYAPITQEKERGVNDAKPEKDLAYNNKKHPNGKLCIHREIIF